MRTPYIIAEVAQGYEGSERLVGLFVRAAAAAGADAVKFQIFTADELALPDYKHYALFQSLELEAGVWRAAVGRAHDLKLDFFSDLFGLASLELLEAAGVDGYKIHTTDIDNEVLLRAVSRTGKRVLLSTGGAELAEIDKALDALGGADVTLMYGFQSEPTPIEDNHLAKLRVLAQRYGKPVGFMDHTEGGAPLAHSLPFAALGLGATVIEKHLTLSRLARLEDFVSAMTPEEFGPWADELRQAVAALGDATWSLSEREREYRAKVRRAVCSARDIPEGAVLAASDVVLKRTDTEDALLDMSEAVGKTAARPIPANTAITMEDLR